MEIIWFMIPVTILLGSIFLALFLINLNNGQYEDLETPAYKILIDDTDKEIENE